MVRAVRVARGTARLGAVVVALVAARVQAQPQVPAKSPPFANAGSAKAPAPADGSFLAHLVRAVRARLDEAAAAHVVKLVPPVPVAVKWRPQKLGSLDLGAPLAAITAADLDADGKAELYLVTAREVIAVGFAGKLRELGRVAFTGEPAVPASRDVVGTAVVEGAAVIAGVSAWAKDLRVEWRGNALTAKPGAGGLVVCGERLALATGRNHFRDGAAALFGARCPGGLTDATGAPLRLRGELSATGVLEISVATCAADGTECKPARSHVYKEVGVAFDIADVDRDGTPDVIASSASAPGDADAVRVIALGSPASKPTFKKTFNGGVAGVVAADGDGDGVPEVIAAVRLAGATRIDLWRLD
jgi:hypothetical protein